MMKKRLFIAQICFFILGFFSIGLTIAQVYAHEESHHKVVFENDYIRLLDGLVQAKDTTLTHIHAVSSVVLFLSPAIFGIQNRGEAPVIAKVSAGDVVYRPYGEHPVTHVVWSQDQSLFHFLVVELKKQFQNLDSCPILSQQEVILKWQEKLVRAYKVSLAKDKSIKIPRSGCAHLIITVSGSAQVRRSGEVKVLRINEFEFLKPQSEIEVTTANGKDAELVLLEFK